jgi:hypothetical protein
MINGTS